jgi:hypothetical protein
MCVVERAVCVTVRYTHIVYVVYGGGLQGEVSKCACCGGKVMWVSHGVLLLTVGCVCGGDGTVSTLMVHVERDIDGGTHNNTISRFDVNTELPCRGGADMSGVTQVCVMMDGSGMPGGKYRVEGQKWGNWGHLGVFGVEESCH